MLTSSFGILLREQLRALNTDMKDLLSSAEYEKVRTTIEGFTLAVEENLEDQKNMKERISNLIRLI